MIVVLILGILVARCTTTINVGCVGGIVISCGNRPINPATKQKIVARILWAGIPF